MQIKSINGFTARCEARGVERDASLFMLGDDSVAVGDYVLIHVGYAIQKVSAEAARSTWALFDEVSAPDAQSAG